MVGEQEGREDAFSDGTLATEKRRDPIERYTSIVIA